MLRPIALYLPQFHPILENDLWWGKGFTEWTNVTKAKPLFEGHYQPHLPSDLGFYDLRLEESRLAQEALAREYGIYGFCYYHYWFSGKLLLTEPLDRKYKNPKEDLPFMLCWANENWTRVWDGGDRNVLIGQNYSNDDDLIHIKYLLPLFKSDRYIKVNGKPVFCIYRSSLFPDIRNTIQLWREFAAKEGIELYLCRFEALGEQKIDPVSLGFDAAIQFPPFGVGQNISEEKKIISRHRLLNSVKSRFSKIYRDYFQKANFLNYEEIIKNDLDSFPPDYKLYPTVMPGWDNTSRRKRPTIVKHSNPERFGEWVNSKVKRFVPFSEHENFFFINAWNEWAEGNHLEPCQKWGRSYLDALKSNLSDV
jgi:lipopolysaccharide biosynthesis protein